MGQKMIKRITLLKIIMIIIVSKTMATTIAIKKN